MRYFFALLLLFCGSSWATFPADGTTLGYYTYSGSYLMPGVYASYQELCTKWAAQTGWPLTSSTPTGCTIKNGLTAVVVERQTLWICPANASRTGNECNCNTGYFETNNTCQANPPPPTCTAGAAGADFRFTLAPGQPTPQFAQETDGRCVLEYKDTICTVGPDGTRYCATSSKYTGDYCPVSGCTGDGSANNKPSNTPPKDQQPENHGPCQAGYYYGTVNGMVVCVPGQGTESKNTTTTTTTNADGSGKTTTTTSNQTTGTSSNGTASNQLTQQTLEMIWQAAQKTSFQGPPSVPSTVAIPSASGETKTTTVTNADGSVTKYDVTKNADGTTDVTTTNGTVKKTTNTTNCTGTSCTSTTTETINGTKTSETSGQNSLDGLCKANPDLKLCGKEKEGAWGGTCDSGFTCEGDVVQCAISRELHNRQCQLYKDDKQDQTRFDAAVSNTDGKSAQALKDAAAAGASSVGVFNTAGYGWARSCPADPHIPLTWVSGGELVIPFSRICGPLGLLAAGAVAMNLLGCMVFVVRS